MIFLFVVEISENWPENGQIEFRNVTIRYGANLKPIIHDACLQIRPGEKVFLLFGKIID